MGVESEIFITEGGTYKCKLPWYLHGLKFKPCEHCKRIPTVTTQGHQLSLVILDEIAEWKQ